MEAGIAGRRFQDLKPFRERNWRFILVWQDEFTNGKRHRKRKRVTVAPATIPEREIRKIAAEYLRPMNQGLSLTNSAASFVSFVDQVYRTTVMPLLAKSTQDRYQEIIENYLRPQFGDLCLRDPTSLTVQRYFTSMANSSLSVKSRYKIRDVLSSILTVAVQLRPAAPSA